jgi:hypothetical protein
VKSYKHPAGVYTVGIPDSWEYSPTKNGIAIYQTAHGVGAVNLSTFRTNHAAPKPAAKILAEGLPPGFPVEKISAPALHGTQPDVAYAEYEEGKLWWRAWILKAENRVVYATYNCDIEVKRQEEEVVDEIVRSIRIPILI